MEYIEFIERLEKLGVIHQFLNNVEVYWMGQHKITLSEAYSTIADPPHEETLRGVFHWETSPEGTKFWSKVNTQILRMSNLKMNNYESI